MRIIGKIDDLRQCEAPRNDIQNYLSSDLQLWSDSFHHSWKWDCFSNVM